MKKIILYLLIAIPLFSCTKRTAEMDLSGEWSVKLDSLDKGINENWQGHIFDQLVTIPGTLDDAKIGTPNTLKPALEKPQLTHLTRLHSYIGAAWYSKEIDIPSSWDNKDFILSIERVLWDTQVWIDDTRVTGHEESLSAPHYYDLTPYLTPGSKHILTVRIDNRKRHDISIDMAHSYTDHTQIKWNGMIGDVVITPLDKVRAQGVNLYPNIDKNEVSAIVTLNNNAHTDTNLTIEMTVATKTGDKKLPVIKKEVKAKKGVSQVEIVYPMGEDYIKWSEFTPQIYNATIVTSNSEGFESTVSEDFGMRKIQNVGNKMFINDKPLFLRGTLECCIFPLTGTPPMDKDGWVKVFSAAKEYGLNHLRFHSWCPPKAAFEVADQMGFYIQVELPAWVLTIGEDKGAVQFLRDEADRIIAEYGSHPSFCMWSLGNELQGDFTVLSDMLDEIKAKDTRHLYTTTSFTFEKGHGVWPEKNDDFFITQWTDKGWVRGQGVFNTYKPQFDKDYTAQLVGSNAPLITHEIGQYSVYPDLTEIEKYNGVLTPLNFMAVKQDLEKKGLIDKAPLYLKASGELAAILYKEEIERDLKTAGISGFQLLDLHDFPGQGTALVGLLNAFWESKGVISGEEFREFCSPVVPLIKFSKATYQNNERFNATIDLCNYSDDIIKNKTISWEVKNGSEVLKNGAFNIDKADFGYNGELGNIDVELSGVTKASKLEVVVKVDDTSYINRWNIWVYPSSSEVNWGAVKYTRDYNKAMALLEKGETVLYNPEWKTIKGIEGKFVPVFWSPVHFPKQAGTMGVLCNPDHKALSDFPTDIHTDWQWWDLNINSTTMIVDELKGGNAIVEMIDNFANNRRLASLYEGKVGNGKLMIASFDLNEKLDERIVAKQMLVSILNYMNSNDFNPAKLENLESMKDSFGTTKNTKEDATSIY
ncbi:MAG: glycoside hydrolase family 2 TIM barrel-domain containing protein [Rikenellaceae bacterium]